VGRYRPLMAEGIGDLGVAVAPEHIHQRRDNPGAGPGPLRRKLRQAQVTGRALEVLEFVAETLENEKITSRPRISDTVKHPALWGQFATRRAKPLRRRANRPCESCVGKGGLVVPSTAGAYSAARNRPSTGRVHSSTTAAGVAADAATAAAGASPT